MSERPILHCPKCKEEKYSVVGDVLGDEMLECLECGFDFFKSEAIIGVDPVIP